MTALAPPLGGGHAPYSFGSLFQALIDELGWSRNRLAVEAGCSPSYLTRISHGERAAPSRDLLEAMARVMELSTADCSRLFIAAGLVPERWDPALEACADVLTDMRLSAPDRDEFREIVVRLAHRYRASAPDYQALMALEALAGEEATDG